MWTFIPWVSSKNWNRRFALAQPRVVGLRSYFEGLVRVYALWFGTLTRSWEALSCSEQTQIWKILGFKTAKFACGRSSSNLTHVSYLSSGRYFLRWLQQFSLLVIWFSVTQLSLLQETKLSTLQNCKSLKHGSDAESATLCDFWDKPNVNYNIRNTVILFYHMQISLFWNRGFFKFSLFGAW